MKQIVLLRSWHCPMDLTLDGRAVTPGEARNSKYFRALRVCAIGNGGNPGGRRLSASGFLVSVFIHRCQAARPQLPPPAASSQLRQTQLAQQHSELQTFQLHNGCLQPISDIHIKLFGLIFLHDSSGI
jgi:hypothetical protein